MNSKMTKVAVCALVAVAFASPHMAQAQETTVVLPQQRLITVSGEADVKVVPDEVVLTLGLSTSDKSLAVAKQKNNDRMKGLLAVTKQLGIAPKDIQSGYIEINPYRYDYRGNYSVNRTVTVTLRKLANYDEVLTRLVQNNRANSVSGVTFRTSKLKQYREQARDLALKAAQEKAKLMAKTLGGEIGKPASIREEGVYQPIYFGYGYGSPYSASYAQSNISLNAVGSSYTPSETLAPGQLPVTARVTVSFELQ